ncbi:DUF6502 family protein [Ramlibacter sp. Leaf400]|uniref:DUF6502 family protein n=1 Tax=Ramlibacter sp. Leaf400 TaxID=1736365 RepID=UPI0006FFCB07|nr:DUF6502 family protein [Ramlibacter sp. Leaf400]KQT07610.1 hypothetical protein ASG30_17410 [Ramlibacter sp. Leaf400]
MQDRLTWAQAACARVMRPLVRLALGMGLKHPHLESMLRDLLLEEATRLWQRQGVAAPNISQLAVTTGLNRKDVTARVRRPADPLPHTELSAAAKTFTRWLQLASQDPALLRLPIAAGAEGTSFEDVAREASRGDVHHRAVLDELTRLGMCSKVDPTHVELTAEGFVPTADLQSTLAFLGDNLRDHAAAAVSNALGEAPLLLERAVFAEGLSEADCEAVHQLMRQRWSTLHRELVSQLSEAITRSGAQGARRLRVGVYLFHEEREAQQ